MTSTDRFEAIRQQKADLLCEATTAMLSRREIVDFSIATFVDGASLLIRTDGPQSLQAMAGQKIGVLAGTTTEEALHNSLEEAGITADVVPAKNHEEGLAMLDAGSISAYFADRAILQSLIKQSKDQKKLLIFDATRLTAGWAHGMVFNDFARALKELEPEIAKIPAQHDSCNGRKEMLVNLGHAVGSDEEHAARFVEPAAPAWLTQQTGELCVNLVKIIRRVIVHDDDVGAEILDAPVFLRVQQLPHERDGARIADANNHDRQIA